MHDQSQYWQARDVAEGYERHFAPRYSDPARDLIRLAQPPVGGLVLDVGTGTGAAATVARDSVGEAGVVVATDPSLAMLRRGRGAGHLTAAADVMSLPFADASFDLVTASFVVGWLADHQRGLSEMARVARTGGCIAVSWHGETNDETDDGLWAIWSDRLLTMADEEALADIWAQALPSSDHFSDPEHMERALQAVGLDDLRIEQRRYRSSWSVEEFVEAASNAPDARFVRHHVGAAAWEEFRTGSTQVLKNRFGGMAHDTEVAILAVGSKR